MAVNPNSPVVAETFITIQVATFADLPGPEETRAGTFAWVEQTVGLNPAGIYQLHWVNNTTHVWEYVGGGSSAALPDQRFTVGPFAYTLQLPGVATYTSVAAGINAANNGIGTGLGAATASSRRLVEVQPFPYAETLTLRPFVNVRGMGVSPNDTVIDNAPGALVVTTAASGEVYQVENLRIGGSITITADHSILVIFRRCVFSETTFASILATVADNERLTLVFEDCSGRIDTFSASGDGGVSIVFRGSLDGGTQDSILELGAPIVLDTVSVSNVQIDDGAHLARSAVPGPFFSFAPTVGGSWELVLGRCRLDNDLAAGLPTAFCLSGALVTGGTLRVVAPILAQLPDRWCESLAANVVTVLVREYALLGSTILASALPLRSTGALVSDVETPAIRSNRTRNVRRYTADGSFALPVPGPFGPAFYISNAPNPGALDFDAFADEHWFAVDYGGAPPNSDTADPLFHFALFQLPEPGLLEDGRVYTIKNSTNPLLVAPVAIALPNVAEPPLLSRIDWLNPRPVAFPDLVVSGQYIILESGESVQLTVDRFWNDGAVSPTHRGQYRITGRNF